MEVVLIILVAAAIYGLASVCIVPQQTIKIVETFGKYSRSLEPGLNFVFAPFQRVAGKVDLRIAEVRSEVNVKTIDNMFVDLPVNIQLRVNAERAKDAYYRLTNPPKQISTWVLNTVRTTSSSMTLDDMFKDRDKIVNQVTEELSVKLSDYGFLLEAVLIDQPSVPQSVQESFNRVVAAKRAAEAAEQEGRAEKIRLVAVAEAEAQAQRERARGLADARKTLAEGIAESMTAFKEHGVPFGESINMLTEINRIDAMREIGKHGNLILVDLDSHGGIALNLPTAKDSFPQKK